MNTAAPTLVVPLSLLSMLTPAKTCQSQGGSVLECDKKDTPTTASPQSSDSERIISPDSTCHFQGGGPDLEFIMTTPSLADHLSSVLMMITPAKTCQSQGGAQLESDIRDPTTPAAPPSCDSERYISPASTCLLQSGAGLERATVQPLLLLVLLCRKRKQCSRATSR
jgi:hypothetical protein